MSEHTRNQKRMYRIHKQEEKILEQELMIASLQQKVEQLEERCEYLERSNNRREDEIIELRDENVDLVSKNNQLENIRKESTEYVRKHPCNTWYYTKERDNTQTFGNREVIRCDTELLNILNKGSNNEESYD